MSLPPTKSAQTSGLVQFEFRPYRRPFRQPLNTHHGEWQLREGILLRFRNSAGQVGYGEIAPIPWFGSETLAAAIDFCRQQPPEFNLATLSTLPAALPACQFGFESAWASLSTPTSPPAAELTYSALLPAGEQALHTWPLLWEQGYRTLKWKIGVFQLAKELRVLEQLADRLPPSTQLRLDANGGLSQADTQTWLQHCDAINASSAIQIEFLEQPLPPDQLEAMQQLTQQYKTPLALDESVATLEQLQTCYLQGWRGVFVVKPAIAGSPSRLRQLCHLYNLDLVFSTAFETAIGRAAGLQLAAALSDRAAGYGTTHWFADTEIDDFEQLWNSL